MTYQVGRTVLSSAVTIPNVVTGSAYSALDALGSAFEIPYAVGDKGGLLAQINVFDRGTASAHMRFHFFSTAFSATVVGDTWLLARVDEPNYLGYVDVSAWVPAGAALIGKSIENIGLYGMSASRSVWCQVQTTGTPTFQATASGQRVSLVVLQD